jgi:hypothetical protein
MGRSYDHIQINKESNIAGKTLKTLRVREKWESTSLLLREENMIKIPTKMTFISWRRNLCWN